MNPSMARITIWTEKNVIYIFLEHLEQFHHKAHKHSALLPIREEYKPFVKVYIMKECFCEGMINNNN